MSNDTMIILSWYDGQYHYLNNDLLIKALKDNHLLDEFQNWEGGFISAHVENLVDLRDTIENNCLNCDQNEKEGALLIIKDMIKIARADKQEVFKAQFL